MKKIFLLLYIFICSNFSYSQLTLSSVEFLDNQRDLTFTNPVTNTTETRNLVLSIGKISDPSIEVINTNTGIITADANLQILKATIFKHNWSDASEINNNGFDFEEWQQLCHDQKNDHCKII